MSNNRYDPSNHHLWVMSRNEERLSDNLSAEERKKIEGDNEKLINFVFQLDSRFVSFCLGSLYWYAYLLFSQLEMEIFGAIFLVSCIYSIFYVDNKISNHNHLLRWFSFKYSTK